MGGVPVERQCARPLEVASPKKWEARGAGFFGVVSSCMPVLRSCWGGKGILGDLRVGRCRSIYV